MSERFKVGEQVLCVRPPNSTDDHGADGAVGTICGPLRRRRFETYSWRTAMSYLVELDGKELRALPEWLRKLPPEPKAASWDQCAFKPNDATVF